MKIAWELKEMALKSKHGIGIDASWPNWCWMFTFRGKCYTFQVCRWKTAPMLGWDYSDRRSWDCCRGISVMVTLFRVMIGFEIEFAP